MKVENLAIWTEIQRGELSEDYKERFKAEYRALVIRLKKLETMLFKLRYDKLDFKPSCPEEVLEKQYYSMEQYAKTLRERAIIEDFAL